MTVRLEVNQENVVVGDTVTFSVLYPTQGGYNTGPSYGSYPPSSLYQIQVVAGDGAQVFPPSGTPLLDTTDDADQGFLIDIDPGDITGGIPVSAWLLNSGEVIAGTLFWASET